MAIKNIVTNALTTPMSRKEFLTQIGAVLLALIGVTAIMHALGAANHQNLSGSGHGTSGGYGSSAYGG